MKRLAFSVGLIAISLVGCDKTPDTPPPEFLHGTHYAVVTTNEMTGSVPQTAWLSLHYYPDGPKGAESLVWPYLTVDQTAVFDKLVVFNGGLEDDVTWKYYPALLAYEGSGSVVEISSLACRRIPGALDYWTNFAFKVLFTSNNILLLDASQRLPIDSRQPKRVEVQLDAVEIARAVQLAQTNDNVQVFDGVKYHVAE